MDEEESSMRKRTIGREMKQSRRFRHTEDVMAFEPDFEFSTSGPHIPHIYNADENTSDFYDDDFYGSDNGDMESLIISDTKRTIHHPLSWCKRIQEKLQGDVASILFLLFLYTLQGVPLGLISMTSFLLSRQQFSLSQQAVFSVTSWPFSAKLLWAPIVDSFYIKSLGRRKSWLIPCQYLIGLFMLFLSIRINAIMGSDGNPPNVIKLTFSFLLLNFIAATQDIAVDGWALTMLSRRNVGYASVCNEVGQTIGTMLGSVLFFKLESKNFANFFRKTPKPYGLVDLAGFLFIWAIVFIVSTTLVLVFKKEIDRSTISSHDSAKPDEDELELGILQTYALMWKIIKLKPMLWMILFFLTAKIAFAASDGMTTLKLISMGVPIDEWSNLFLFMIPAQILLPWFISKWTAGPRPLNVFLFTYPFRLILCALFTGILWCTPWFMDGKEFLPSFYVVWGFGHLFHKIVNHTMFVSVMSFNAQISDPKIGGTYMTLLNTMNNLGSNWPVSLAMTLTDYVTFRSCYLNGTRNVLGTCNTEGTATHCTNMGNVCETDVDGYYILSIVCIIIGLIWYIVALKKVRYLQTIPKTEWRVITNPSR